MSYPPIYIINLKRTPERKLHMQRQLDALNLKYQFIDAIDKYDLSSQAYRTEIASQLDIDKAVIEDMYIQLSEERIGPFACALSHIKVYHLITQNNISCACVLEDDIHILPAFSKILVAAQKVSWDVLMLSSQARTIREVISGFYYHRLDGFRRLIHYKKYYPQLNPFTVRLIILSCPKLFYLLLKKAIQKRTIRITEILFGQRLVENIACEIGGVPNQDKRSWYKVSSNHYIANPYRYREIYTSALTSGMAYILTPEAAIKLKQRFIFLFTNVVFHTIDVIPFNLFERNDLNLYITVPPCVRVADRFLIRSLVRKLNISRS